MFALPHAFTVPASSRTAGAAIAAILLLTVAGCTSGATAPSPESTTATRSSASPQSTPTTAIAATTPATTSSTSPSATSHSSVAPDPDVRAAVTAFRKFFAAYIAAQRAPTRPTQMSKYAFSPFLDIAAGDIVFLFSGKDGLAYRGTPPSLRLRVVRSQTAASPKSVILSDCDTPAPTWLPYDVVTGKVATIIASKPPLPYRVTVTVIFQAGHWGVSTEKLDRSKTCTGP